MTASASASRRMVEWLDGGDLDPARVGGKAASLIRLARHGFRIPPGFCLTTDAFDAHVATLPGDTDVRDDPTALLDPLARAALHEAMLARPLDPAFAEVIAAALERLCASPNGDIDPTARLAVRSSGVAEDGAGASFAGLHDTELGLAPDQVAAAVVRCWASLWSDRAIGYRHRRGLALDGGSMAVVVQALVPAQAAAVAFTRHPVTGRSDQILINAVPGLGEAMVSGLVTPDTIVVDKASGTVIDFTPGDVTPGGNAGPALADDVLDRLVSLCLEVERAFEAPVDIEAAHAADGWYLLQARPITTP